MNELKPYAQWDKGMLDFSIALRERERARDDAKQMSDVAARLAVALGTPPRTRRAAAQLQEDLGLWEQWTKEGRSLPKLRNKRVKRDTTKSPKLKRIKPGLGRERDEIWQAKGEAKRRQRVLVFETVSLTGADVFECDGVNRLIFQSENFSE
ncbi:MAG TPA: hypothetical protein VFK06_25240 [Candidatus Angelobacter sp.]|nr:hypothetical protein [Candidatus Angelobacter sp.]